MTAENEIKPAAPAEALDGGRCAVDAGFGVFWHDLPDNERDRIKATPGLTVGEFMKRYKQPTWCEYPEALGGQMGCWSLVLTNRIHSIDDCKNCDCCTSPNTNALPRPAKQDVGSGA
jgi:hypothetical protein